MVLFISALTFFLNYGKEYRIFQHLEHIFIEKILCDVERMCLHRATFGERLDFVSQTHPFNYQDTQINLLVTGKDLYAG